MTRSKYPKLKRIYKSLREELSTAEKDCTQERLAKELGLSKPQISRLESGLKEPSLTELRAYSKFFKCPMEYLLGINESRYYKSCATSSELGLSNTAIDNLKLFNKDESKKMFLLLLNLLIEKGEDFQILTFLSEYLFNLPESFSFEQDTIEPCNKDAAKEMETRLQNVHNDEEIETILKDYTDDWKFKVTKSNKSDYVYVNNKNKSGFPIDIKEVRRFIMLSLQDRLNDFRKFIASKDYNEILPNGVYHYSNYVDDLMDN